MSQHRYADCCAHCTQYGRLERRRFLGLLSVGVAAILTGSTPAWGSRRRKVRSGRSGLTTTTFSPTTVSPSSGPLDGQIFAEIHGGDLMELQPVILDEIPPPHPGSPRTIFGGPTSADQIAITIDDGYCSQCVTTYVEFVQQTGLAITFSPNGTYGPLWTPYASTLRPLIEMGQVQIGNHTYSHPDLTKLSDAAIEEELERNEQWVQSVFGVTTRPWFRPPYGSHDTRTDEIAGQLGYTNILMWNGSFGDSTLISPEQIMSLANEYLRSGTIMLGHANHPTILPLLSQILDLINSRGLKPVTLDSMFGTSRMVG